MLSKEQIKQFKDDGYVVVRNLLDKKEVDLIIQYTEELQNAEEVSGKEWKYFEEIKLDKNKKVLSRIENFCKFHKGFEEICTQNKIIDCVNDCFGEEGILFKDKINLKMPGVAGLILIKIHKLVGMIMQNFI